MRKEATIKIHCCKWDDHNLTDADPEYIGDGTNALVVQGDCDKCGLNVQFWFTREEVSMAVRLPTQDDPVYEEVHKVGVATIKSRVPQ